MRSLPRRTVVLRHRTAHGQRHRHDRGGSVSPEPQRCDLGRPREWIRITITYVLVLTVVASIIGWALTR